MVMNVNKAKNYITFSCLDVRFLERKGKREGRGKKLGRRLVRMMKKKKRRRRRIKKTERAAGGGRLRKQNAGGKMYRRKEGQNKYKKRNTKEDIKEGDRKREENRGRQGGKRIVEERGNEEDRGKETEG